MNATQEQIGKLGKGVQAYIRRLEQENERLHDQNEWLKSENRIAVAGSNVTVVQGLENKTAIADHSEIEFSLSDEEKKRRRSSVSVRLRRDGKSIEVVGYASSPLIISPQSSNVIVVSLGD